MTEDVPPVLTEGHLRLLMEEQHESETLDYKRKLELGGEGGRRAIVELAKDVGAMASTRGGYLCIGCDERGQPTGEVDDAQAQELDESRIRPKLERYLPSRLDLRTAVHEIDGCKVGLIYVGRHPDALAIFKADGNYDQEGGSHTLFREGDVFVRRGTQSRRWSQEDAQRWLHEIRRAADDAAVERAASQLQPLIEQLRATEVVSQAPAEALSWRLDRSTLVSAATDQLRRGDDIPLRLLLESAPAEFERTAAASGDEQPEDLDAARDDAEVGLAGLLDRIVALAARGIVLEHNDLTSRAVDALVAVYNSVFDAEGMERRDLLQDPARIWLMILERVYALGGLAMRKRDWQTVRRLSTARPADHRHHYYRAWLRHGHIMAAGARLLQDEGHPRVGTSLLKLAMEQVAKTPELRPDLPVDDDRVLSSLCQFDLLANLAAAATTGQLESGVAYPHFKRFFSHRSDPAVIALLEDEEARQAIFPSEDQELADALRELGRFGAQAPEFVLTAGWDGFEDRRIEEFLAAHPGQP